MLSQLYVENIAVIEKTTVDFENGFNVLTGETGAGKSILIDAINLILGFRVSKDIIRTGESRASVSALLTGIGAEASEKLRSLGFEPDEDRSLLIAREISIDGKSSCKIQGRPATVSILREVGGSLITIHGQHDNQSLLSPEKHLFFLDGYAGTSDLLSEYQGVYSRMKEIERQIHELSIDESEKARKLDMLKFQIDEIEDADISEEEESELLSRKKKIKNSEKILEDLQGAVLAFGGDEEQPGLCDLLNDAQRSVGSLSRYLDEYGPVAEKLQEMYYELEEYSSDLKDALSGFDYDPRELNDIEARLDLYYRLKRKYGASVSDVLAFYSQIKSEYETIELSDQQIVKLTEELSRVKQKAVALAKQLSTVRTKRGKEFAKKIMGELAFLNMPSAVFEVSMVPAELAPTGGDAVEFLLSANPGETPKPLSKIASGGELSRIMLAIKNVVAENDDVDTLIFDEIDTGVSGKAAQKIGLKLKEAAGTRQVICITHLAQIAALADRHLLIEKTVKNNRSFTQVTSLDFDGRKRELARIMSGDKITDLMLQNAEEMLTHR